MKLVCVTDDDPRVLQRITDLGLEVFRQQMSNINLSAVLTQTTPNSAYE